MIGEPFQFEGDSAQRLRPRRHAAGRQGFDRLAIRQRVPDGRIAGEGFHVRNRPLVRAPDERAFNAAMLVAE